jgi:hypothetical protein
MSTKKKKNDSKKPLSRCTDAVEMYNSVRKELPQPTQIFIDKKKEGRKTKCRVKCAIRLVN